MEFWEGAPGKGDIEGEGLEILMGVAESKAAGGMWGSLCPAVTLPLKPVIQSQLRRLRIEIKSFVSLRNSCGRSLFEKKKKAFIAHCFKVFRCPLHKWGQAVKLCVPQWGAGRLISPHIRKRSHFG